MKLDHVQLALQTIFNDDRRWAHQGRRLVFWYDAEGEFASEVSSLSLPGVKVEVLQHTPFNIKRQLLVDDSQRPYLLYASYAEPAAAQNWLLDLQLTGVPFTADRAAMIFADLGFHNRSLEHVIRDHLKFFRSEKRLDDLRQLRLPAQVDERGLLAGLLAVAVREKVPESGSIIRQVLLGGLDDDNASWAELQKLGLEEAFWSLARAAAGFVANPPTLRRLFITLLLAHMSHQAPGDLPTQLQSQLPPNTTPGYSLIASWMRDARDHQRLQQLIQEVEADLGMAEWAQAQTPEHLRQVDTFPVFEKVVLRQLVDALIAGGRPAQVLQLASERQGLHYAQELQPEYRAVNAAAAFLEQRERFTQALPLDAERLLEGYAQDWYVFDRLYRQYLVAADQASRDLLTDLTGRIERDYLAWVSALAQAWTDAFDVTLPARLEVQRRQWSFYRWHVQPLLEKNDRDRVVVIISDALRYEVATELREALLQELRGEALLVSMLSTLPSQTRWGMAALLPGGDLSWDAQTDRVLRGGQPTAQADRELHLSRTGYASLAMKLDELASLSTEQARMALEGKRLVYLYHDAIDALGDKPASEMDVLAGCSVAIQELERAVRRLVNNLNVSTVLVTSDHGFLYQRTKIGDPDKLQPPVKGAEVSLDRRAIIGPELPSSEGSLHVNLPEYQAVRGPLQGLFPRGTLRYRIQGGSAQYVHGGASLQEMVVPVLTYRHRRASAGLPQASRKVRVEVVSRSRRVTNNVFNVTLVQAEALAERLKPRTVTVQLQDERGRAVTDRKRVTLNSASPHPTERQQVVRLSVTIPDPDENAPYFLTVTDDEDSLELIREPWEIRIAFKDDFGF